MRRGALLITSILVFALAGYGQSDFDTSPGQQTGERVLGSYFATDIDSVSLTNGNLHLNIPLFNLPGRELPLRLNMNYDSRFFETATFYDAWGQPYQDQEFMGWRKDTGVSGLLTNRDTAVDPHVGYGNTFNSQLFWIESNGTKHAFQMQRTAECRDGDGYAAPWNMETCTGGVINWNTNLDNRTFDSTESDFIRLSTGNYFAWPPGPATISFKDGTTLSISPSTTGNASVFTTNGNRLDGGYATGSRTAHNINLRDTLPLQDTAGRTILYQDVNNIEWITIQDANGQNKTYQIRWQTISGQRVVQSIVLPNNRSYVFAYTPAVYMSKVTLPSGAYIRYTYSQPASAGYNVESRIVSADGTAASEKTTTYVYTYSGGVVTSATVTDPVGTVVKHYYTGGLETRVETRGPNQLFTRVDKSWAGDSNQKVQIVTTTLPSFLVRQTTYGYDAYNNLTAIDDYDWSSGSALRSIRRTYLTTNPVNGINYTTYRILNRLSVESVYSGATLVAQTQYEYDNYESPNTRVGRSGTVPKWSITGLPANVTGVKRWLNTTNTWLTTVNRYDVLGNVVAVTDPGGHATNMDFTDRFSDNTSRNSFVYPTQVTDASGFYVQTTYDFNTGLVKQTTDSLSRTTTNSYDLMNRTTQINYPNSGQTSYSYDDDALTTTETKKVDGAGNVGRVTYHFDKLYRVLQKQTADPDGDIYVDTVYDDKGRQQKVSNPYRSGDTVLWTQFQYDALDRPTVTTAPDGSTVQYGYAGNQTTVTDEAGNQRRYTYDGLGRMTQVEEPNVTLETPLVTSYAYNVLGKLTQTVQGSQTRTFVFDSLGRMTSQSLPESGNTTFTYNADSQLLTKTDARNITTTYGYNNIHKPTGQTYSDSTPAVAFLYDTANRRREMTDGLGTVTYAYDANTDRLTQESRVLTGVTGTFSTGYDYNIKGDLKQMTYPSGRVVNYNYATGGGCCNSRLASVLDQTTSTTMSSSLVYNAAGETTSRTLGNSVIETFGYNSRLQGTTISAALGTSTLMNFAYDYGTSSTNTGRVLVRTDAIQSEHSAKYFYDSIYRLGQVASNDVANSWGIGWTFDVWGNRVSQTPQGLATSKVGTQTLGYTNNRNTSNTYDAAGNQTNDGLHSYTFNAENQITQMDAGAAVYGYDGEGTRMKKTVGSETTYSFYGVGGLLCEFTTTNTGATAAASTDKALYRTSDKLGSAVLVLTASGTVIENNRTLPYGEAWLSETASTNDKKFTTYQRDSESGLDYAMARYDSTTSGRFTSPDPGPYHWASPQSLNRYVYLMNDPLNAVDPTGEDPCEDLGYGQCSVTVTTEPPPPICIADDVCAAMNGSVFPSFNTGMPLQAINTPSCGTLFVESPGQIGPGCWMPQEAPLESQTLNIVIDIQGVRGLIALGRGVVGAITGVFGSGAATTAGTAFGTASVGAAEIKVLQTGGNTLWQSTATALNEYFETNLTRREWGRALEALKNDLGLPANYHGKINAVGNYLSEAGEILGNISGYLP